jgi:hypothetical protein
MARAPRGPRRAESAHLARHAFGYTARVIGWLALYGKELPHTRHALQFVVTPINEPDD